MERTTQGCGGSSSRSWTQRSAGRGALGEDAAAAAAWTWTEGGEAGAAAWEHRGYAQRRRHGGVDSVTGTGSQLRAGIQRHLAARRGTAGPPWPVLPPRPAGGALRLSGWQPGSEF